MGWLHDALDFSLETVVSKSADEPKQPQRGGPFGRLIEHILFSRRFVLTYHLVILGFVLVLTVRHWFAKAIRWRIRRNSRLRTLKLDDVYDGDAEAIKSKL